MAKQATMLSTQAYETLRQRISAMPSGQYLSARQYSKELGMSYTPVREAFLKLQSEGILRQVPNVGFFVASPEISDMIQYFQVRECIDGFVLRKVFHKLGPEHVARMKACCDRQREALARQNAYDAMSADEEFHRIPLELLGNTVLLRTYESVRSQYLLYMNALAKSSDLGESGHRRIIACIEAGDPDGAYEESMRHIADAKLQLMESYLTRNE